MSESKILNAKDNSLKAAEYRPHASTFGVSRFVTPLHKDNLVPGTAFCLEIACGNVCTKLLGKKTCSRLSKTKLKSSVSKGINVHFSGRILTEESVKKYKDQIRFYTNIYAQLPMLLLDPDPQRPRDDYSKIKLILKDRRSIYRTIGATSQGHKVSQVSLDTKIIPGILVHPALTWLALALHREVLGFNVVRSDRKVGRRPWGYYYESVYAFKPSKFFQKLETLVAPEELYRIIRERDYQKGTMLWYKLRPFLNKMTDYSYITRNAWFNDRSRNVSSLRCFEQICQEGGWSTFPSPYSAWKGSHRYFSEENEKYLLWERWVRKQNRGRLKRLDRTNKEKLHEKFLEQIRKRTAK
jgi:hypothetical protein